MIMFKVCLSSSAHPCTIPVTNLGRRIFGCFKKDADAQVHEGLGEVDHGLSGVVDCHGGHCDISALVDELTDDAVPFTGLVVIKAVQVVRDRVQLETEAYDVRDGLRKR